MGRFSDNSPGYPLIERWLEVRICSGLWISLMAQPTTQGLQERLEYCGQRNLGWNMQMGVRKRPENVKFSVPY